MQYIEMFNQYPIFVSLRIITLMYSNVPDRVQMLNKDYYYNYYKFKLCS